MAEKVADLYADLSIRGDDFDQRLNSAKQGLTQVGKAADESSEKVRQSAVKSANAYERVRTEVDKAASAARTASQKHVDAAEREKLAVDRLADAEKKHGQLSAEVIRAQKRVADAHRETARMANAAEKATDQYTVKQKQAANAAQKAAQEMRRAGEQIDNSMPDGSRMDGFASKLGALGEKGSEVGGNFGGSFMAGFAPKIASLGSKGGPIGAAVAGVAVVGLAAGALLAKSIADGAQRQGDQNVVQAQLGIDDATAARLGKAASEAYMQNFGATVQENMDSIRAAMQSGLLPRDASQGQMQEVAQQLATVSQVMGTDIPETARAAGQAIKTGLVKNGTEAMDLLVAGTQRGLNINDDLLDTLNEYGTQFRKVGLDGQTALGLVAQAMQGGARDSDVAADAIKEFAVRAIDGSESTRGAFEAMNLNADEMGAKFSQGGATAREALGQVLDKLHNLPPDVDKNKIAVALFGTQLEDLGGAFDKFDLSKAANELGNVGGAAQRAADTMGKGPAATWEQTKRTIEEATMGIKQSMAEAFGPTIGTMAQGLLENKDQVVAFFADIVSAALSFGIAMGNTAAGVLHIWGSTVGQLGELVGGMVETLGTAMGWVGNLLSKIPGMDSVGNAIKSAGETAQGAGEALKGMGDAAHGAANFIADTLVPGMATARDAVNSAGDAARMSAQGMDALRGSVQSIPDAKTVIISDNSPETKAKLEALGFTVTTLPDGTVKVVAKTEEAQAMIDRLQKPGEKWINIRTKVEQTDYAARLIDQIVARNPQSNADGSIREFANGKLPDEALIQRPDPRGGLVQWAEPETGGEAFIPLAPGKRGRSTSILSEVADRFGYRLTAFADGSMTAGYGLPGGTSIGYGGSGFPDWISQLGGAHNVKPSTYAGHQESDRGEAGYAPNPQGLNRGIDWSGSVADMQAFAEYMMSVAKSDPAVEQVIWMNPETGQKLGWHGRSPDADGSYFASDYPGHTDHVHTRFSAQVGANASGPDAAATAPAVAIVPITQNPDGTWTSPSPAWAHLIQRESGGNPTIVQGIQDANSGGNEASGLFQIAKGTWSGYGGTQYAPTAGQATPEQQSIIAAKIFNAEGGSPWGSGLPGREDDDGLRAGLTMSSPPQTGSLYYTVDPATGEVVQTESSASPGNPPEDPYTAEITFTNPLEPFWWKGEKDYRQRIIDQHEKEKAWDEYWSKTGESDTTSKSDGTAAKKGKKLPSLAEAEEDLRDAQESLKIAEQRQRELKPEAKESSKMSAQRAVTKANQAVTDAQTVIDQVKANPSGYLPHEVKKYANGDIRNGHQAEIVRPGDYRVWGEPESGGESYIPHAPDRRARAVDIWAKTGRILGVKGFAAGGFGGYTADTRDASAPKNLYDLLSLGVGGTMMAANAVSPYVMSAITGKWNLGDITPQFDMKANSNSDVTQLVSGVAGQISSQLTEIVWAIKEGKNITVKINDATGPAGLSLTRQGK